jgi:hypothetical protein
MNTQQYAATSALKGRAQRYLQLDWSLDLAPERYDAWLDDNPAKVTGDDPDDQATYWALLRPAPELSQSQVESLTVLKHCQLLDIRISQCLALVYQYYRQRPHWYRIFAISQPAVVTKLLALLESLWIAIIGTPGPHKKQLNIAGRIEY